MSRRSAKPRFRTARALRRAGAPAAALLALLATAAPAAAQTGTPNGSQGGDAGQGGDQAQLIARGKYLATLGDCVSCHTGAERPQFSGGRYMDMPFGKISTPNITPDKETGIGNYTDDDFLRVLHEGINKQGEHLYPAMPYPWYSEMTRDDALAIKAYLFSLPPVHAPREANHIYFPFTLRSFISVWNWMFSPAQVFQPDPKKTAEQNRGAYIVMALEHCAECHNGRNLFGNSASALGFQGGIIEHWSTPNLTSDKEVGLGRYTDDQLFHFLKEGHAEGMGTVAGPMAEAVDDSLSKLTDADLHAIVAFLRTLPPKPQYTRAEQPIYTLPTSAGAKTYLKFCVSCHMPDGKGIKGQVPALDGNGLVRTAGPQSVIKVILGGHEARGRDAPMPGLGAGMTDQEIVDVTNYVRQAWSNRAPPNASPRLVRELESGTHTLMNGERPGGCPQLVEPELRQVLSDPHSDIGGLLKSITLPTMLPKVDEIVAKVKAAAPGMKRDDIVNGLMVAYCPIVAQDDKLDSRQKAWLLDHFSERVYTQLAANGKY